MHVSLKFKFLFIITATLVVVTGLITCLTVMTIRNDSRAFARDLTSHGIRLVSQSLERSLDDLAARVHLWTRLLIKPIEPCGVASNLELFSDEVIAISVFLTDTNRITGLISEWQNPELLSKFKLNRDQLISFKQRENLANSLVSAAKSGIVSGEFQVINSTVSDRLPSVTMVLLEQAGPSNQHVTVAEVSSERILKRYQEEAQYTLYLLDSNFNILVHSNSERPRDEIAYKNLDVIQRLKSGDTNKIYLADFWSEQIGSELSYSVTGAYARLGFGGLSLVIELPTRVLLESERRLEIQAIVVIGVVIIWALIMMIVFTASMIKPLEKLALLTRDIAKGIFSRKISVRRNDEIGELAGSFNRMCEELAKREFALEEAKKKLIQSEKMSAFGQMSAGIAHEVKNPLAGILGYAQLSRKKIEASHPVANYLEIIEHETVRCKEIVENLMKFARQEKAVFSKIDISKTVQNAIRLVEHQMGIGGVQIVKGFANDGNPIFVNGNANQIQQVLMNLMLNAQHAMPSGGTLTVTTHLNQRLNEMMIVVSDTGCGMSEEVVQRVFEPFFTTKGEGKGTGLGLSVSYGIIKDHQGTINVESEVGRGSTFTITLPMVSVEDVPVTERGAA